MRIGALCRPCCRRNCAPRRFNGRYAVGNSELIAPILVNAVTGDVEFRDAAWRTARNDEAAVTAGLEQFHTEALRFGPSLLLAPVQVALSAGHRLVPQDQLNPVGVDAAFCQ